jgi:hypothetical protein
VREVGFFDAFAAIDPVERLEETVVLLGVAAVAQPAHEVSCLLVETDRDKSVERETRVSEPGVAVVPVAHPTDPLG